MADTVPERKRDGHTGKLCEGVDHHLRPHSQHRFWGWLHIDTISVHQKTILNESLKHPRSRKPNPAAQESYEDWINSGIQAITVFVKICLCLPLPFSTCIRSRDLGTVILLRLRLRINLAYFIKLSTSWIASASLRICYQDKLHSKPGQFQCLFPPILTPRIFLDVS